MLSRAVRRFSTEVRPRPRLNFDDVQSAFKTRSTFELARAYLIFKLCTIRPLVKNAPALLAFSNKYLGKSLTTFAIRHSFFAHFCAGEDDTTIQPTLARLAQAGVGGILDYAAEADVEAEGGGNGGVGKKDASHPPVSQGHGASRMSYTTNAAGGGSDVLPPSIAAEEAQLDRNLETMIHAIQSSKRTGGFVAVKVTALAPPELLQSVSSLLQDHRRAYRRFNIAGVHNPYKDLKVSLQDFLRVLKGPRINERDATDLFIAADYGKDGVLDYIEWSDFMAMLTVGGEEARAAARQAIPGADPGTITSLLVPGIVSAGGDGLTPTQRVCLKNLLRRADALGAAAAEAGVTIMVDAEQTYLQPAIDLVTINMMRKYNRPLAAVQTHGWTPLENLHVLNTLKARLGEDVSGGVNHPDTWATGNTRTGRTGPPPPSPFPLTPAPSSSTYPVVYNTYQAYLTNASSRLQIGLARAEREGFLFGAKIVRGAYMVQERARAQEMGYHDPICPNIEATHASFHKCVDVLMERVANRGAEVMIASHNEKSIGLLTQKMEELGLPPSSRGVSFGQLLGMCDHISFSLGANGYNVFKYVPYGPVQEVVPYLIRRAQENSDVLGGVGKEIRLLEGELKRRIFSRG